MSLLLLSHEKTKANPGSVLSLEHLPKLDSATSRSDLRWYKKRKKKLLFALFLLNFFLLFKKLCANVQMPGELHDAQILPVANLPEVWACFSREKSYFVLAFGLSASFHNQHTPYFGS